MKVQKKWHQGNISLRSLCRNTGKHCCEQTSQPLSFHQLSICFGETLMVGLGDLQNLFQPKSPYGYGRINFALFLYARVLQTFLLGCFYCPWQAQQILQSAPGSAVATFTRCQVVSFKNNTQLFRNMCTTHLGTTGLQLQLWPAFEQISQYLSCPCNVLIST